MSVQWAGIRARMVATEFHKNKIIAAKNAKMH